MVLLGRRTPLLCVVLICLMFCTCCVGRGARGGGASRASTRSSTRTSTRTRTSRYYSGASYRKSTILSYMTLVTYAHWYQSSMYYRYSRDDPEYCLVCTGSENNATCVDKYKTVCKQSSDCYTVSYVNSTGTALLDKGCLYEQYGIDGCDEKQAACVAAGNQNCTCSYCTTPFCNQATHVAKPLLGLVLAALCGHILAYFV